MFRKYLSKEIAFSFFVVPENRTYGLNWANPFDVDLQVMVILC